jgi:histone H3/H4
MYSPKAKARRDCQIAKILLAATVQKIITEILPPSDGQVFARDARDLLIECCVEFVTLISTEANDISEKEAKKTIAVDHIEKALTELGFADYVPEVLAVADEFKDQQKVRMDFRVSLRHACLIFGWLQTREKRVNKMETSGLSEAELLKMQEEMFASAREKYHTGPEEGGE